MCPSCGCLYQGYHDCEVMDDTLCPSCGCLYQGYHDCEEMDDCKNDNGKNNFSLTWIVTMLGLCINPQ